MASYVIHLTGTSSNLADWRVIDLTDTEGGYVNPATGHQEIDICGYDKNGPSSITVGVAWADCNINKNGAVIGVTKYEEIRMSHVSRRTGLNNSSGGYVYDSISTGGAGFKIPIPIAQIGTCIDFRQLPQNGIRRIILVGVIDSDLFIPPFEYTLIITPTKIAS